MQQRVRFKLGVTIILLIVAMASGQRLHASVRGQATIATPPRCNSTEGTYKNDRGDIATVSIPSYGAANENQVTIYLKQQTYQPSLTFTYFVPNGTGIRRTNDPTERSVYYSNWGGWVVAMFGESNPLRSANPKLVVPDSLWFQVSCQVSVTAAQRLVIPTTQLSIASTPTTTPSPVSASLGNHSVLATYQFSEVVAGGPGSVQAREYDIKLYKVGDRYTADIDVDGFQTLQRLYANVDNDRPNNRTAFYFVLYREGNLGKPYQPGDLLFELEKLPDGRTRIIFGKLRSLYQNRQEYTFGEFPI